MNRSWSIMLVILSLLTGFYLLNYYIYDEKQSQALRDGVHLGFVGAVDSDEGEILFDTAIWMSGEEGKDVAISLGLCTEETREECLPNDYIIYNEEEEYEVLSLNDNVVVTMQTWRAEEFGISDRIINIVEFGEAINEDNLFWRNLPYRVEIRDGQVVGIDEVYVP